MSQPHPEGRDPRVGGCTSWGRSPGTARRSTPGAPTPSWPALSDAAGRTVGERALIQEVSGPDQPPANPAKALQVVVSRTRSQTAPEVVERAEGGYRLGLGAATVDAVTLRHDLAAAVEAEATETG